GCCRQSVRTIHFNKPRFDSLSRDSARNRLRRQELKDTQKSGSYCEYGTDLPDSVPVRPASDLLKALGFSIGVGAVCFTVASLSDWQRQKTMMNQQSPSHADNAIKDSSQKGLLTDLEFFGFPVENIYQQLIYGPKCVMFLIASNALVFLLWRARGLKPMMHRYFTDSFASKSLLSPMILSVFSHATPSHLRNNMLYIGAFTLFSVDTFLGPDQFAAFYLTASAFSSLASLAYFAVLRSPVRSLGASGASAGLFTYTLCKMTYDAPLLCFQLFAAGAVLGKVVLELAHLIKGFPQTKIGHASHLGGALFGIAYACWGERLMWGWWRKHVQENVKEE
ncbi:hypothetical protein PMAYCL1PPCAC_08786, partial [Pristionchus mayeri]